MTTRINQWFSNWEQIHDARVCDVSLQKLTLQVQTRNNTWFNETLCVIILHAHQSSSLVLTWSLSVWVAFMQLVEVVNDNNNCYGNEEIETLHNSRSPPQQQQMIKRRDNESHQRRERVLRECMSDAENASERRTQLGWILSERI